MKVVILRGIPGAGKSRFSHNHYLHAPVCSADTFFEKRGKWNPFEIAEAHRTCFADFIRYMEEGHRTIVVDNTNVLLSHFKHYVEEAQKRGYEVEIIRININPHFAATRNIHKVPLKTILKMYRLMQPCPPEYNEKVI